MKRIKILLIIAVLILLSACAELQPSPTAQTPALKFSPKLTMHEEGKVHFELGVMNEANQEQPSIKDINIRVVITNEDGMIRNQMAIVDLGPIPENTVVYPMNYDAFYNSGNYMMTLTGENIPSLSLPFEIREDDGIRKLAASYQYIDPHTGFTITDPDL